MKVLSNTSQWRPKFFGFVLLLLSTPLSLIWGHGDLGAVLAIFVLLGAIPGLPISFVIVRFTLKKFQVPKSGNIWFSILQVLGISAAVMLAFWQLAQNQEMLNSVRPVLLTVWALGIGVVFGRFGWLESHDIGMVLFSGVFGVFGFPLLTTGFAFLIGFAMMAFK